ncbi:helix-turn-helix domain-containing protein [Bacillus safensis]|uniref:helix-turn-helix domain-containing protein n=1 Tax=Bacillus safensis TaxID=561879 RepID=UPI0036513322
MPGMSCIGEVIARRRVDLRLTQQTVADLAGVARSSVQALECGSGSVKLATVVEVAGVVFNYVDDRPTGWRDPMALTLFGRGNRLRREHFVDAGLRLGVRERATNRMIDSVADPAEAWVDRCVEIGYPDRETDRLAALLRDRIGSLR